MTVRRLLGMDHEAESRGTYHPLLGTNVEIVISAVGPDALAAERLADAAGEAALRELLRLEQVFSIFRPDSDLSLWRSGAAIDPPAELIEVLAAAEHWWRFSAGAFHPAAGALWQCWRRAEAADAPPDPNELARLTAQLATLPFTVVDGELRRVGDCGGVDLHALAKGYIVDRAVEAAGAHEGVIDVLVNAGGDLRHEGGRSRRVGVQNPTDPGGPPARVVELTSGALATSGPVHRGFRIAGRWYGHVLDPRTGYPVEGRPSTTIRARDAMTADALATVIGVLPWTDAADVIGSLDAAALSITAAGQVLAAGDW